MTMGSDFRRRCRLTKTSDVGVAGSLDLGVGGFVTSPAVIGGDDLPQVLFGKLTVDAVDEGAHFPGVDEEGLLAAIAFLPVVLVPREEPEADGDLGGVEELAGECDHAVDEVRLDEGFSDLAFAGLV